MARKVKKLANLELKSGFFDDFLMIFYPCSEFFVKIRLNLCDFDHLISESLISVFVVLFRDFDEFFNGIFGRF